MHALPIVLKQRVHHPPSRADCLANNEGCHACIAHCSHASRGCVIHQVELIASENHGKEGVGGIFITDCHCKREVCVPIVLSRLL